MARRFLIIASASGSGKTMLGRELAARLGVDFVELDGWVHGPGWVQTSDAELIARVEPVLERDGWVIDGGYQQKLGTRVFDAAEVVIWLDPPLVLWLSRLIRRSWRRWRGLEALWNGNTESLAGLFGGRDSLFGYALSNWRRRRREWPLELAQYPVIRLRSRRQVADFLDRFTAPAKRRPEGGGADQRHPEHLPG